MQQVPASIGSPSTHQHAWFSSSFSSPHMAFNRSFQQQSWFTPISLSFHQPRSTSSRQQGASSAAFMSLGQTRFQHSSIIFTHHWAKHCTFPSASLVHLAPLMAQHMQPVQQPIQQQASSAAGAFHPLHGRQPSPTHYRPNICLSSSHHGSSHACSRVISSISCSQFMAFTGSSFHIRAHHGCSSHMGAVSSASSSSIISISTVPIVRAQSISQQHFQVVICKFQGALWTLKFNSPLVISKR